MRHERAIERTPWSPFTPGIHRREIDDVERPRRQMPYAVIALCLALATVVVTSPPSSRQPGSLKHAALASSITSWGNQLATQTVTSTSCAGSTGENCVVVGTANNGDPGSMTTTDQGRDWNNGVFPSSSTGPLNGVSCIDAEHCWAVGTTAATAGDPSVFVTSNGILV